MSLESALCRTLNGAFAVPPLPWLFPPPALGRRGDPLAYAECEFRNGGRILPAFAPFDDLRGRTVLDIGCGQGGKSVWCALHGAREVLGVDLAAGKIEVAQAFARRQEAANVRFEARDAAALLCADGQFDLVLLIDALEHLDDPGRVLGECRRVLRPGGRLLLSFPPYGSPWGAHLFAHIRIPWAQFLFSEEALVRTWKALDRRCPRGAVVYSPERRAAIAAARSVRELMGLNGMTVGRFEELVRGSGLRERWRRCRTPGGLFGPLIRSRRLREHLVSRLAAVLEK